MKRFVRTLISGILTAISGVSGNGAQPHPPSLDPELMIHLYNLASVPDPLLGGAIDRAGDVLASAGINPVWLQGLADAAEAHRVDPGKHKDWNAPDYPSRGFIVVVLAKDVPVYYAKGALGIAFPASETGVSAIVFYDRIERLKQTSETDRSTVLGLAIAHEIGHVLLRSSLHGKVGIMKSPWTRADLQCAEARLATFTHAESAAIRQHSTRTTHTGSLP